MCLPDKQTVELLSVNGISCLAEEEELWLIWGFELVHRSFPLHYPNPTGIKAILSYGC